MREIRLYRRIGSELGEGKELWRKLRKIMRRLKNGWTWLLVKWRDWRKKFVDWWYWLVN